MVNWGRETLLFCIGLIYIIFGVSSVVNALYLGNPTQILWGCYMGLLLLGAGVLQRNGRLIGSQLCILLIPVLLWNVDFFYRLITGEVLWGVTTYMFERGFNISRIISLQ